MSAEIAKGEHVNDSKLAKDRREHLREAWKTSEDVAMHFNSLLLGFRLKAVGGIAAGAVVGFGLKLGDLAHWGIVLAIFVTLAVIWALVWAADFFYYYRLLAGAVDELLRLEKELGDIRLSHLIERRVNGEGRPTSDADALRDYSAKYPKRVPSWPIWLFYIVPTVILVSAAVCVWIVPNAVPHDGCTQ